MSSEIVRSQIGSFLTTNASGEVQVVLDGEYDLLKDLLASKGVIVPGPWLGIEFIGGDEEPITVPATNTQGKYRETGAIQVHVVDVARLGVSASILARATALRNLFRGQRIGSIRIESVTPANFGQGATIDFQGGYTSASFLVSYESDLDL